MITGTMMAHLASHETLASRDALNPLLVPRQPFLREIHHVIAMKPVPKSSPGITPPRKSLLIEALVTTPYSTKVLLGGISVPIIPAQAISAAANALS